MNVEELVTIYRANTPSEIQSEIDLDKVDTQVHRNFIKDEAMNANMWYLIPNIDSSGTQINLLSMKLAGMHLLFMKLVGMHRAQHASTPRSCN